MPDLEAGDLASLDFARVVRFTLAVEGLVAFDFALLALVDLLDTFPVFLVDFAFILYLLFKLSSV